ncbi:MAG: exo-alpha-sialidase [Chloroflexi bacterium]|nr:exo-alpha-sialidase [Chloroflexota bacterium]
MPRSRSIAALLASAVVAVIGLAVVLDGNTRPNAPSTGLAAPAPSPTLVAPAPTSAFPPVPTSTHTADARLGGTGAGLPAPAPARGDEPAGGEDRGGDEELEEQREGTEKRLEALRQAIAEGRFGSREPLTGAVAPGWAGERIVKVGTDDWEPAVAADSNAPYVYILVTRYEERESCRKCPTPYIALEISRDGGRTWSNGRPICRCEDGPKGQFDPIIEVVPDNGHVYAVWMNDFHVVFSRSTDHGRTWTEPVPTYGDVRWNDKPTMTSSANGRDVYVSWNGPTGGDPWIAVSHDRGRTWTQTLVAQSDRYYFAFDSAVTPEGTAVFSESSISYTGPGGAPEGVVRHHAFVSEDRGATWDRVRVDEVELGEDCVAEGCSSDFYNGHTALAGDATGRLYFTYDGATTPGGPQKIWFRTSDDDGQTWSDRVRLSAAGEVATSPAIEAVGRGDVRLWYMQTRNGDHDAWNVWYLRSTDGGDTWSAPVRISDRASGADYKTGLGFMEVYGDYGELAITNRGETIAVWGEGFSWVGPGGAWFNRTR